VNLLAIGSTLLLIASSRLKYAFSASFYIKTVISGKKSFPWPGKIGVCLINIVICKNVDWFNLIRLIGCFEVTLFCHHIDMAGKCTLWRLRQVGPF
jgi:hypothetical protein